MVEERMSLSFEASAAPFVMRCFGLRVVDGVLRKPGPQEWEDAMCCECGKVLGQPDDVGGFFRTDAGPRPCCKAVLCLVEAEGKAKDGNEQEA